MAGTTVFIFKAEFSPVVKGMMTHGGSSRVTLKLSHEMSKAAKTVGLVGRSVMRGVIQRGVPPPNAHMTVILKGSSKPLVGKTARLWKSVTSKVEKSGGWPTAVHIGVMRTSGPEHVKIAKIVHNGTEITVTKKMARMFDLLNRHSDPHAYMRNGKPPPPLTSPRARELLAGATGPIPSLREGRKIVIPARPFALITMTNPKFRAAVKREFGGAVRKTFKVGK
jgi:hypothetical protein